MKHLPKESIDPFVFAGNATFTIINEKTGGRYTFKLTRPKAIQGGTLDVWFVKVLRTSDNESGYSFVGTVFEKDNERGGTFKYYNHSYKSTISEEAPSVVAFMWFLTHRHQLPDLVKVYHEGKCGHCGRKLTVPESIKSGFGPKCTTLMKGVA